MTFTDDADRATFAGNYSDQFDCDGPYGDYDPMHDGPGDGPKCGGCYRNEYGEIEGCPGCKHCFPPDAEAISTGFEIWEHPDFYRVRSELNCTSQYGYCRPAHDANYRPSPLLCRILGYNPRLYRAALRKLDRICDESETHAEAKDRYEAWANFAKEKLGVIDHAR